MAELTQNAIRQQDRCIDRRGLTRNKTELVYMNKAKQRWEQLFSKYQAVCSHKAC